MKAALQAARPVRRKGVGAVHGTAGVHGPIPPDPVTAMAGQVDPRDPEIGPMIVVNPAELGITGWGPPNDQPYQSGQSNDIKTNASAEQGTGVGPERKWPHYPHATNPNPYRDHGVLRRNGGLVAGTVVYRPEVAAYWQQAMFNEAAVAATRHRGRRGTVNQAPSVPYVSTVPPISPGGY